jgi:hypothetical protein
MNAAKIMKHNAPGWLRWQSAAVASGIPHESADYNKENQYQNFKKGRILYRNPAFSRLADIGAVTYPRSNEYSAQLWWQNAPCVPHILLALMRFGD